MAEEPTLLNGMGSGIGVHLTPEVDMGGKGVSTPFIASKENVINHEGTTSVTLEFVSPIVEEKAKKKMHKFKIKPRPSTNTVPSFGLHDVVRSTPLVDS